MTRILIVEDDPAVRDVLEHALWREGMETETAPDGEKALQSLGDAKPFDLVGRQVFAEGGLVELTAKEFDVLWLLASHPAQDARGWIYPSRAEGDASGPTKSGSSRRCSCW